MNELERRLRESLRARAEDVEPTPELWSEVQERRERKRRVRWIGAVAAAAAAVVVAVVAVPFALDALQPDQTDVILGNPPATEPVTPPSPTVPPTEVVVPPLANPAFATDGTGLYPVGPNGTFGDLIYRFPAAGESSIVAFDVRPRSAGGDPLTTTIAMLTQAEGTYDLRWVQIRYADDTPEVEVTAELFPDPYNVQNHQVGGSVPAPVWSSDGRHLAFVEDGDEGEPTVRVIGWDEDGPGTGRTADDNASFGRPVLPPGVDARLQDWVWDGSGGAVQGAILATALGGGGYALEVERQGDGAVAYRRTVELEADGALLDVARDTGPNDAEYRLTARDDGQGVIDLTLTRISADGLPEELPLPAELDRLQSSDPTGVWMNAAGDGVLVGDGDRLWLVSQSRPGQWEATSVHADLTYADFAG